MGALSPCSLRSILGLNFSRNDVPEALGGTPITASTMVAAFLVCFGAAVAASLVSKLNLGVASSPIAIGCVSAACYAAYVFYNYGTHTGSHTAADNAYSVGSSHPWIYGTAVACGVAASILGSGQAYEM